MCNPAPRQQVREPKFQRMVLDIAISLLKNIVIIIHILIDRALEAFFSWLWKERKTCVELRENFFVTKSATDIAEIIRKRELTCYHVVKAYIQRMNEVNPLLNAVVDGPFEAEALAEATQIDERLERGQISEEELRKKPFLGVPFTTKDSTAVKGKLHTLGLLSRANVRAEEDADCVRLMKEAGAIIIATTNIPEVNRWVESRNNLTGQTNNPFDHRRTVGGSSGGEGALITSCGSCFGLGTDIGGSIRIPASSCGIFGHKPTVCAVNTKGCTFRTGDETDTMVVAGPMSRYARDLLPMMKILADPRYEAKLNLDLKVNVKKLRYFYCNELSDPLVPPLCREMKDLMVKVSEHLSETSGRMCKRVRFEGMKKTSKLFRYWMTQEPANFVHLLNKGRDLNGFVELVKFCLGQSQFTFASILSLLQDYLPLKKVEQLRETTTQLQQELETLLGDDGVLIFPSNSSSAGFHFTPFFQPYRFSYYSIFNILRVPCTQVPMGLDSRGLPLGVQVVAPAFRDRDCLAVAGELERAFGGWTPPFKVNQ